MDLCFLGRIYNDSIDTCYIVLEKTHHMGHFGQAEVVKCFPKLKLKYGMKSKAANALQCKLNVKLVAALLFIPYFNFWKMFDLFEEIARIDNAELSSNRTK